MKPFRERKQTTTLTITIVLVALLATFALALPADSVLAQAARSVDINPRQGPPGTVIDVDVNNFAANAAVSVGLGVAGAEPQVQKTLTTSITGDAETTFTIPDDAEVGREWRVVALQAGESVLSQPFTVTEPNGGITCGNTYVVQPGDWLAAIARACNTSVSALLAANPTIVSPNLIFPGRELIIPGGSAPADPRVDVVPDAAQPGAQIEVNASGFAPNAAGVIGFGVTGAEPIADIVVETNNVGAIEMIITLPEQAEPDETWRVLVSVGGESVLSEPISVTEVQPQASLAYGFDLNLRAEPRPGAEILDVVPANTSVPFLNIGPEGDWFQVRYDDQTGWIFGLYANVVDPVQDGDGDADGGAEGPCGNVYIVQPGDFLRSIAEECDTTVSALLAANPTIGNANIIYTGQRLVLPGGSGPAEPRVSIVPDAGPPGTEIAVDASGFAPNAEVIVGLGVANAEPSVEQTVTTNDLGALETTITLPEDADIGRTWRVLVNNPGLQGDSALSEDFTVSSTDVVATTRYNLNLRNEPSATSDILDTVPVDTTVAVEGIGPEENWVLVNYQGREGWLYAPYTQLTGNVETVPVRGSFTSAEIFLIALEDAGASGQEVGCGDSVVPVTIDIEATQAPLTAAIERLVALDEETYGETELYNALHQSDLTVESVAIEDGTATIRLSGELLLGGICDEPRVLAQLRQTALQYDTVDNVQILLNGDPLDEILGG